MSKQRKAIGRKIGDCPECKHPWDEHVGALDTQCRANIGGNHPCCCSEDPFLYDRSDPKLGGQAAMCVSLDNGLTFQPVLQGVRVHYEDVDIGDEDPKGEVQFNFTEEGLITDIWVGDDNIATDSEELSHIVERLTGDSE